MQATITYHPPRLKPSDEPLRELLADTLSPTMRKLIAARLRRWGRRVAAEQRMEN